MSRTLNLELPEDRYQALAAVAAREGLSPAAVGRTWLIDAIARRTVQTTHTQDKLRIVWEGAFLDPHSISQVNREACLRLIKLGHELTLIPPVAGRAAVRRFSGDEVLEGCFHRALSGPIAAHVRHEWPPSFVPPPEGHWVIMQPWEYGSVPRPWVLPMSTLVDEVWAYSTFVRDSYIAGGVPADSVHVVPLGIDHERFHPEARPFPLKTSKPFRFLFVGGTIHRKGIDVLLRAYSETFTADDPVCLVIKDIGGTSFYRGQTARQHIGELQADSRMAEIEYLEDELGDDDLAGLYTACHCLVQPYRGEGFCLPIAEAMACGLPVIVTGHGAALDYCNDENAFLIPARIVRFREKRIGDLETVDYPFLAEPSPEALRRILRLVFDHPDQARTKAMAGLAYVRTRLTWDHAVRAIETRLAEMRHRPVRRFEQGPSNQRTHHADRSSTAANSASIETCAGKRQRVSLCMIVKNEAAHLAACLGSVADLVHEIVVVDTGSTDATAAVAASFGARVFPFQWVDSFAAARNESLVHAQGEWIFWLDGDELLDRENRLKLQSLLAELPDENVAYVMSQRSPVAPGSKAAVIVDQVRLFRRLPGIQWDYRVHEQILPVLRRTKVDLRRSHVVIQHAGHEDLALRSRKLERDLRLLLIENDERPDDPFILFNLGALYRETNRPADALPLLRRSLERSRPSDSIVPKLHAMVVACLRQLRQPHEALAACHAGRAHGPDDELLFHEAQIWRELGDAGRAEEVLLDLLTTSPTDRLVNGDAGLRGYKARHHLALIYEESGRAAKAEAHWRAAIMENPQFNPAWVRLGELYLKQCRWSDAEDVAARLSVNPAGGEHAGSIRTRALKGRQESPPSGAKPRVSLCMIVKDGEKSLAACLESVADLVDEMIVVDTGSTDRTRAVATRAGACVSDFAWVDDFSAARNESIAHATGDWIFWLDADEQIDETNREKLRAVFAGLNWENVAYLMQQLSSTDDPYGTRVAADHVRLFRRDPALRWEYRVHEQILISIRRAGHDVRRTDVVISHSGFQTPDDSKLKRNLSLLLRQHAERPDDPIALYQLGLALQRLGRAAEALPILRRSLELVPPDYSIRPRLYAAIARAHESRNQKAEALAVCRAGREQYADVEELLFLEASLLHAEGEEARAEELLLRLLRAPSGQQLAAGDTGRRGYKARHLLAEVYRCQDRRAEAEAQWRLVVAAEPRFAPAWQSLGELYVAQGRWAELDEVMGALAEVNEPEAAALKARALLARNQETTTRLLPERDACLGLPGGELLERSTAVDTATPPVMAPPVPRPAPPAPDRTALTQPKGEKSFSQAGEDLIVKFTLEFLGIRSITYLDIGANHPVRLNNTYLFYLSGYKGVLVEPNVSLCERLRAVRPRDLTLAAGIGLTAAREADYFIMTNPALNTFSEQEVVHQAKASKGAIAVKEVIKMPLLNINDVMGEHFQGAPTFLSVDTEGLDLAILQSIDYTRFRPKVICAETLLSSTTKMRPEIREFMATQGYVDRGGSFVNTIFIDSKIL